MTDQSYTHSPHPVKSDSGTQPRGRARGDRYLKDTSARSLSEDWRTLVAKGVDALITEFGLRGAEQVLEMEAEEIAGTKGKHHPGRTARRYGYARTYVAFGGRKVCLRRPRLRTVDNGQEVPLASMSFLHDSEVLRSRVLEVFLGTSQRAYRQTAQAFVETSRTEYADSKTTAGRRFRAALEPIVTEMRTRPIESEILVVYMDGIGYADHLVIAAMGMKADGTKEILGLESGTTEDEASCRRLLENLIARGLSPESPRLFVLDGGKGLHAAVTHTFGDRAYVQRCAAHKIRNVLGKLPESLHQETQRSFVQALAEGNAEKAQQRLKILVRCLKEGGHPKAAASLEEGLEELVTVNRLGLTRSVRRLLRTTNPIESAFSQAGRQAERVRRWQNGRQVLRWVAFGLWRVRRAFQPLLNSAQVEALRISLGTHMPADIHLIA